jgi:glyoxylase-like metal-dependent hydrolase (beta-lactamase superfamily II)
MPPAEARPFITFREAINFHFEEEDIQIFLAPAAHPDGDAMVYFSGSNVMHLGDVFRTTSYPVIDVYNGGSVKGIIQALDQAIALANSDTKIIPGHGLEIVGRKELIEFRDMIVTIRDRVYAMIEEGMVLDVVMENAPSKDFDAKWGQEAGWTTVDFIPIVFHELGGEARYRGK